MMARNYQLRRKVPHLAYDTAKSTRRDAAKICTRNIELNWLLTPRACLLPAGDKEMQILAFAAEVMPENDDGSFISGS